MRVLGRGIPEPAEVEAVLYQPAPEGEDRPTIKRITAAAQLFPKSTIGADRKDVSGAGSSFAKQQLAWKYYDQHPEVSFYAQWNANGMGKIRLFAGQLNYDGDIEQIQDPDHEAVVLTNIIANGRVGQSSMLKTFGQLLSVAGEGWIIVFPDFESVNGSDLRWEVLSRSEISIYGTTIRATIDDRDIEISLDGDNPSYDDRFAMRIWTPHPNKRIEADSPVLRALGILGELSLLNAAILAIAQSRITGRGILFVPEGISLPAGPDEQGSTDDIMEALLEAAEIAIKEPDSAAAAVPLMVQVPGELIAQIEHVTFESDFDEIAIRLREEIIRRFATGIDTPPDILLGDRDSSHWQTWLNQTEAIRMAIEPKVQTVCEALTYQWLQPALRSLGVADANLYVVWYDSSDLRLNANRPQAALEAYNAGLISAPAARRELGFDETDAPEVQMPPPEQRNPIDTRLPTDENRNARELPSIERVEEVTRDAEG